MIETPDQLKSKLLVEKYMYVDAVDQTSLKAELSMLGATYMETTQGLKIVYQDQTPQQMLSRLLTPLTKLDVHKPTLEEAYLDLIKERSEL